jgi:Heterokaryon incompatibility protein Het-C
VRGIAVPRAGVALHGRFWSAQFVFSPTYGSFLLFPHCSQQLTPTGTGNYIELALRELGFSGVFPHTGTATEINLRGRRVFPLVTGSFGVVDFLHSVIGEVTDNFAASEVNELDLELLDATEATKKKKTSGPSSGGSTRGLGDNPAQEVQYLTALLSQIPGGAGLCQQAERLQADSDAREFENLSLGGGSRGVSDYYGSSRAEPPSFDAPPGSIGGPPAPGIPGMSPNFDPVKTAAQIYPILEFRDRVVRAISATIEKIPGLEMLVEKITETLTVFVLSLLSPFIRPIINAISKQLQQGSGGIVEASGKSQYEPWNNPNCTDPTHR